MMDCDRHGPGEWPSRRGVVPVLFRDEDVVPVDHTAVGVGIRERKPRRRRRPDVLRQLLGGPSLAAFDAGVYDDDDDADGGL